MSMDPRHYDVIVSPVITEKATMASEQNKVVFKVALDATKDEIAAAVEELFKVSVVKVNTMNVRGKVRRQFTKAAGRTSDWKKAIVTLKKGDKISLN